MLEMTRRLFLKLTGATTVAIAVGCEKEEKPEQKAEACEPFKKISQFEDWREVKEGRYSTTICPYCGCGCGVIVTTADVGGARKVVNTEGDPDHPVNRGALCSKGSALYQVANNERRAKKVLYRAAGASDWVEKDWSWALDQIAAKMKLTREATFVVTDADGKTVNRCEGLAFLGGAALDNEECYVYHKFARALGGIYMEHQARI